MSKKVLITGAGGFIGANLVRALLARGDEVHIAHRPQSVQWRLTQVADQLRKYNVELSDGKAVLKMIEDIQPEQVFHLAQYGCNPGEDDLVMIRKVIIDGTAALFEACARTNSVKAVINAGSSSEYGSKTTAMKEDMILGPNTPYGCAKAWATLYGQYLAYWQKTPIITLRLFSVFGPWDGPARFMPAAILSCLNGTTLKISNPKNRRDFVFVDDVVKAFLLAADNPYAGEIINIGSSRQMTLEEAVQIIFKQTRVEVKIETGNAGRSFDKSNIMWQANISKAKEMLNWSPKFSQEEGIKKTIKWFYENKSLY